MANLQSLLVAIHLIGNLVWIGAILSVGITLTLPVGTPVERGRIGRMLYLRLAVPAFLVSFTSGLVRLLLSLDLYFVQTKFMHGKLTFALVVIAVHHILGARAGRMASGKVATPGAAASLTMILLVAAAAAAFFAVLRPF
jgi:putative membrane protein